MTIDKRLTLKKGAAMTSDVNRLIHDIRNPLNTISVNAELGKLVLSRKGDMQQAAESFDMILSECRRCSEQLDRLKSHLDDVEQS